MGGKAGPEGPDGKRAGLFGNELDDGRGHAREATLEIGRDDLNPANVAAGMRGLAHAAAWIAASSSRSSAS